MFTVHVRLVAIAVLTLGSMLSLPAYTDSLPSPATHDATIDPCSMLAAPNVASALGVAAESVGTPQRPSASECVWAVAARGDGSTTQSVLLLINATQVKKSPCRGLSCLGIARSVLSMIPGVQVPVQIDSAFADAQLISGLGDKAAWHNGRLTVLQGQVAFQLTVRGSAGSQSQLAVAESLAHNVLARLSPRK